MAKYKFKSLAIAPVTIVCSLMTYPVHAVQSRDIYAHSLPVMSAAPDSVKVDFHHFLSSSIIKRPPNNDMGSDLFAPTYVALLSTYTGLLTRDMHNTLDGHLQEQRLQPAETGKFTVFGGYAGERFKVQSYGWTSGTSDGWTSGTSPTYNLTLGMGYQFNDNWQSGVIFSNHHQHVGSSPAFSSRFYGNMATAYSQLNYLDKGWVNADFHYGLLDYDDIDRKINIGPAIHTEHGKTKGYQSGVRMQAGWNFSLSEHISTGPVASYSLDKTQVRAYAEQGNSPHSMRFLDQTLRSQVGSVGWRIDSKNLPANPWVQVTYSQQFGDTASIVNAKYKLTKFKGYGYVDSGDYHWVETAAGVSVPLGKTVNAYSGLSTLFGKSHYHPVTWNAGINMTF